MVVDEVVIGIVTKVSKDMRVNFSDDCGRSESGQVKVRVTAIATLVKKRRGKRGKYCYPAVKVRVTAVLLRLS